jgi:DNA-binding Lrp family transcriptional regulator
LEDLDEKILSLLQDDGRLSYTDLAKMAGTSRAAITGRLDELTADGSLRIVAAPHPDFVGLTSIAHVSINTSGPAAEAAAELKNWPEVVLVLAIAGSHDLVVEVRLRSQLELHATIGAITRLPMVEEVNTLVYVDVLKGIFMPRQALAEDLRVDETDLRIMRELQDDGRMSYRTLAQRLELSPSAVRQRVLHLLEHHVIRIGATLNRSKRIRTVACGIGMNLRGTGFPLLADLSASSSVEFLARTIGRFDAVATLRAESSAGLHALVEGIKSSEGVTKTETWVHLHVYKERYEWPKPALDSSAHAQPPERDVNPPRR